VRHTQLIKPTTLRTVGADSTYEGARALSTDSDPSYDVSLVQTGKLLNEAQTALQIRYGNGQPGGEHDFIVRPNDLMPRRLFGSFNILTAYGNADNSTFIRNWWGQSDKGVKDFYKFEVDGAAGGRSGHAAKNWRMFSYRGDLYAVADFAGLDANGRDQVVVQLVRYNETDSKFYVVKRFYEDPVDKPTPGRTTQYGSPDVVVYNDKVHIYWRVAAVNEAKNVVVGYRGEGDLSSWTKIAEFDVPNSLTAEYLHTDLNIPHVAQKNFRLRVTEGNGVFMLGYFGIARETGAWSGDQVDIPEFRTFTSYDGGATFTSHQDQILGVVATGPSTLEAGRGSESLHPFFVPRYRSGAQGVEDYSDVNAQFALYFDEEMGAFVILKSGDPNPKNDRYAATSKTGGVYLMAIKTVDGDYSVWEPCLQIEMINNITGLNIGDNPNLFAQEGAYIYDIDVVADDGPNTIVLGMRSRSDIYADEATHGVAVGEFKFVDHRRFLPGDYRKLFTYGVKTHPEYAFVCSSFDMTQAGLISKGRRDNVSSGSRHWTNVTACKWRNQIAAAARPLDALDISFFAVIGPWSTMGEHIGYQFSYCRWHEAPWTNNFLAKNESGTGAINYYSNLGVARCTSDAAADNAYMSGIDTLYSSSPWIRDSEDPYPGIKAKLSVQVTGGPPGSGWVEFLRFGRNNPDLDIGHEIRCRVTGDGNIVVCEPDGTEIETIGLSLDLSKMWDMVFKIGPTPEGNARLTFWYRENGTEQWYAAGLQPLVPSNMSLTPKFQVGFITASGDVTTTVDVGDVFCGTSSSNYHHPFTRNEEGVDGKVEGMDKSLAVLNGHLEEPHSARSCRLYGTDVELRDGSILRFTGASGTKDYGIDWTYGRSLTRNSAANVINGLSGSVWDFTNVHDFDDNRTDLIFENVDREKVDSLTLVNMVGVTSIIVAGGDYDESAGGWDTTPTEYVYDVPYELLNVDAVDGNMIFLDRLDYYSTSELIGYSVIVHDGSSWTDSLVVVDNYDGVIICDGPVPTDLMDEFRLMTPSTTFDLPGSIGDSSGYFGLTLEAADNVSSLQIGEVVFGTAMDISDWVDADGFERDISTTFKGPRSDRGFLHLPTSTIGAVKESVELGFSGLGRLDDSAETVKRIFNELYSYEAPFPLVMEKETGEIVTRMATIASEVSEQLGGFSKEISLTVDLQNWRVRTTSDFQPEAPVVTSWGVDNSNPQVSSSINFFITAEDPNGETLTYDWDFGDESGVSTSDTPSYSYAAVGEYVATVTVTNESGLTATRVFRIIVQPYEVAYYEIVVDDDTPPINSEIQLTVTAKDADDNTLSTDDDTILTWFLLEGTSDPVELSWAANVVTVDHPNHGFPNGSTVDVIAQNATYTQSGAIITVTDADTYWYAKVLSNPPAAPGLARASIVATNYGFDADDDGSYSFSDLIDVQQQLASGVAVQRFISARTGDFTLAAVDRHGKWISQAITVS
jgi:PKD repeat protein